MMKAIANGMISRLSHSPRLSSENVDSKGSVGGLLSLLCGSDCWANAPSLRILRTLSMETKPAKTCISFIPAHPFISLAPSRMDHLNRADRRGTGQSDRMVTLQQRSLAPFFSAVHSDASLAASHVAVSHSPMQALLRKGGGV